MREIQRIIELYKSAYNGSPWIDVSLAAALKPISARQAAKKIFPGWNSIWEIVNHLIAWRENVLERMRGKVIKTPSHNYFMPVRNLSSSAWKETLEKLEITQQQWIVFLQNFNEKDFENIYPGNNLSYYEHIQGIIHHDSYHLGEIVMLAKAV